MIWYIIGAVVVLALILFFVLGKKKTKKEEVEGGQINGSEATTIEPAMEDESQDLKSEEGTDILPEELSAPTQDETTDGEKTI